MYLTIPGGAYPVLINNFLFLTKASGLDSKKTTLLP